MSFDDIAIRVDSVSKRYELYDRPSDQLKQFLFPRLQQYTRQKQKKYYREFWALSDVSLEVRRGEAFGVVGRNGCGKSTLLQIIAGTLTPTFGSVATRGRVAALLELGSGFNPEFSGRENVFLNAALLGFSKEKVAQRFDAIAAFADIGQHLEQPVKSYSSGMVVRLAMAVQLQVEPDILIVDEALAVGDALFQKRCYRQIEKLINNGCALLFVSHDQEVVRSLTKRAIFLNAGKVQMSGSSSDVTFAYREYLQQEEEASYSAQLKNVNAELLKVKKQNSYGNYDVQIVSVSVLGKNGLPQNVFLAGDFMSISVECVCCKDVENLNVAFRVRNKEGVKVTTWGTLNEDMPHLFDDKKYTFWSRKFKAGHSFTVVFSGNCYLAANLYEIEVVVAIEYDGYYLNQRILHWLDEAAHFTVLLRNKQYVFDGICDMGLRSTVPKVTIDGQNQTGFGAMISGVDFDV